MWALRRASVHLRDRGLSSGTCQIFYVKLEIGRCNNENYHSGVIEPQGKQPDESAYSTRFYNTSSSSLKPYTRHLVSQAGAKSNKGQDDDLEDAFSEPEKSHASILGATSGDEIDDDSFSEFEVLGENISDDLQNLLEPLGTETNNGEKRSGIRHISAMTEAVLAAPATSVGTFLDKWVEEGNEVTKTDVLSTMVHLRKRKMFYKALQLLEWLESTNQVEFVERTHASRVDLLAKVHGLFAAEKYLKQIPKSSQDELVYRTLLANCVSSNNQKKAEDVFNRMKAFFSITEFACNQMLLLYKRTDRRKVADILKLMEKENIKPSVFTYQILISFKGQFNDIPGMEQLVKTMKSEGLEPTFQIQASLARQYAFNGQKDKAEAVLREIEGDDLTKNLWVCPLLLPIYASLGREDEVERIWKVCEPNPRLADCMAGIEAWGKLKRIEAAEQAFEKLAKKLKKPGAKHFVALLDVYANHKMLDKGKELVNRMVENNTPVGPFIWHALVKLYIGGGEVEKADSILDKAVKQRKGKPLFTSYLAVLDQYGKRGDVHNAEKMLCKIREAGYMYLSRPYHLVLSAYVNAKAPGYGFKERLKGDNIVPSKSMAALLGQADAFRKSPVDELLE